MENSNHLTVLAEFSVETGRRPSSCLQIPAPWGFYQRARPRLLTISPSGLTGWANLSEDSGTVTLEKVNGSD